MPYRILADLVVVAHLGFIVFVMAGALLALRWPRAAWVHLPAAAWGVGIELFGWTCPLTPLEHWLRAAAGGEAYGGGFVEHYVLPVVYPPGLTRSVQTALGAIVLATNLVLYGLVWRSWRRRRHR